MTTNALRTVNSLGLLYADPGRVQAAEAMYLRVLKGYKVAFAREHTSTLATVNRAAILYCRWISSVYLMDLKVACDGSSRSSVG